MDITVPGLVIISGQQGSGKSNLLKYIMKLLRSKLKYGIAFSQTAFNEGNLDYIPKKYVYTQYDPIALGNLMKIQAAQTKEKRHLAFVVFDDCVVDSWVNCKLFNQLVTQVRHYNVLIIITTQWISKIPPMVRENGFQVAMFSADTHRALEALFESYGQKFENLNQFKKYLQQNTQDFHFVFYNRKDNSYKKLKAPAVVKIRKYKY